MAAIAIGAMNGTRDTSALSTMTVFFAIIGSGHGEQLVNHGDPGKQAHFTKDGIETAIQTEELRLEYLAVAEPGLFLHTWQIDAPVTMENAGNYT